MGVGHREVGKLRRTSSPVGSERFIVGKSVGDRVTDIGN